MFYQNPSVPQISTKFVKPEKLVTQMGATAGAGSGEFHVYRAQRRKELARLAQMDQDALTADADKEFSARVERHTAETAQMAAKNRDKRLKKKARALKGKECHIQPKPFANDGTFLEAFLRKQLEAGVSVKLSGDDDDDDDHESSLTTDADSGSSAPKKDAAVEKEKEEKEEEEKDKEDEDEDENEDEPAAKKSKSAHVDSK